MFVLPLVFLPFIFVMAVNRLIRIPLALHRGQLHVPERRRPLLVLGTAGAYLGLLGYTAGVSVAAFNAALMGAEGVPAWLSIAGYVAAYPLVYMAAAWVFFHSLKTTQG